MQENYMSFHYEEERNTKERGGVHFPDPKKHIHAKVHHTKQ